MTSAEHIRRAVGHECATHDTRSADLETSSESYAQRFAGAAGRWLLSVQERCVSELLSETASRPMSVLEVGGGHGQLTGALLQAGHQIVVQGSHNVCHARLRERGVPVQHVTSALWNLPFRQGAFDLVAAIRLLAHVEDWRGVCAELARVSRGLMLIDFPVRGPIHRFAPHLFTAKRRIEGNTRPYFDYELEEIDHALRSQGMRVLGIRRQFALPMVVHRKLGAPKLSDALERIAAAAGATRAMGSPALLLAARVNAHVPKVGWDEGLGRTAEWYESVGIS